MSTKEVSTKSDMDTTATGRRNRSWPDELKREIVAASFAPGSSVSIVARHYDVNANQVFSWRKRYREDSRPPSVQPAPQLIPVMITAGTSVRSGPSCVNKSSPFMPGNSTSAINASG